MNHDEPNCFTAKIVLHINPFHAGDANEADRQINSYIDRLTATGHEALKIMDVEHSVTAIPTDNNHERELARAAAFGKFFDQMFDFKRATP